MSGAGEFYALAQDLTATGARLLPPLVDALDEAGQLTARRWSSIARVTAGKHGKHYPNSIDHETRGKGFGVEVEVGPNSGKTQGSMGRGFEFGSRNQPPHLDGVKAFDEAEGPVEAALDAVVRGLIP